MAKRLQSRRCVSICRLAGRAGRDAGLSFSGNSELGGAVGHRRNRD